MAPGVARAQAASPPDDDPSTLPSERARFGAHAEGAVLLGKPGGAFLASAELRLDSFIGLELSGGVALEDSEATSAEGGGARGTLTLLPALRLSPFGGSTGWARGAWFASGGGLAWDDGRTRAAIVVRTGLDFDLSEGALGPFVGFVHLPSSSADAGEDRTLFLAGVHGVWGFGADPKPPPREVSSAPRPPERAPALPEERATPDTTPAKSPPPAAPPAPATVERVRFAETLQFPMNDARLGFSAVAALQRIYRQFPTEGLLRVVIEGHSDSMGSEAYNQSLSLARAESARAVLLRWGLSPELVVAEGLADTRPLVTGGGRADIARNRRVEIVIEREVSRQIR